MANKTVIITVSGGVADVEFVPEGITVEIRDYDIGECGEGDNLKIDEDGDRYSLAVFK